MKARYKSCRYNGKRIRLHIAVWMDANGEVPVGYCIHHKDFDKLNNSLNNLVCISVDEHNRLHARMRKRNKKGRFV